MEMRAWKESVWSTWATLHPVHDIIAQSLNVKPFHNGNQGNSNLATKVNYVVPDAQPIRHTHVVSLQTGHALGQHQWFWMGKSILQLTYYRYRLCKATYVEPSYFQVRPATTSSLGPEYGNPKTGHSGDKF